jgi:hypothetical protein
MKTKVFSIGIMFLALLVCTNCSKEEILPTPPGETSALKTAPVESYVVTVVPNGTNDTEAIRAAFDEAIAAGPGSIVYLTEGTFYLTEPIDLVDFKGSLLGAGKDLTEIVTQELNAVNNCFLSFSGTYSVTIADLSFRYNDIQGYTDYLSAVIFNPSELINQVNVQRVGIVGISDQFVHHKWALGLLFFGTFEDQIMTNAVIEQCTFQDAGEAIKIYNMLESTLLVKENQFINCNSGLVEFNTFDSYVEIYKNRFETTQSFSGNVGAIWLFTLTYQNTGEISHFLIHQNEFDINRGYGVSMWDNPYSFPIIKSMNVEIKSNRFKMNGNGVSGITVLGLSDLLIGNNKFEGIAFTAINAWLADNMVVLGDNINNLTCTEFELSDGVFVRFPILLWYNTTNCTVIGNAKDNVLDLGTNNILTGVTRSTATPGPSVSAAMSERIQKILVQYGINP